MSSTRGEILSGQQTVLAPCRVRYTEPRPSFVIVTIHAPSRRRDQQIRLVWEVRAEDYDIENQTPIVFAGAAVESPEIAAHLIALRDEDEYRGRDFEVVVWAEGVYVYDGPGWDAYDTILARADA